MLPESAGEAVSGLWTTLFVARHLVIVALAIGAATLPAFGPDRAWAALLLLGFVLPYDVGLHVYARRIRQLPASMPFVYAVVTAVFVWLFPATWVPSLLAALGNTVLFTLMFPMSVAGASVVASAGAFWGAAIVSDPEPFGLGLLAYATVAPAVVVGVGRLFSAFQHSEERYREYVENANDIIYSHDLQTLRFISATQSALRVTGYTPDELGEITVADVVAPDHVERAAEMIARKVAGEAESTTYELELLTKHGRRVPVEVSTRLIYRRGEPVAVQGIARDISERRQVEAQRLALDKAKTEFIANAAHELRTPLTTLAGLAAVLASSRDRMSAEELDGAIDALARQGRRARLLADKLLDLSAVELGKIDVTLEPLPLQEVVERVLETAPPPDGVRVDVQVPSDLIVLGDHLRLGEILTNLLTNAYRYGGPHVSIDADGCDERVDVRVSDDGPGVAPDLMGSMFEPFTRGDNGSRPDSTGLGLAICARLAGALDGELAYDDAGPGARFRLSLPAG
jgi:PAS domain S-box-containing protein